MEALVILGALLGAVLRRIFGGWLGISRSVCVAVIVGVTAAPAWVAWGGFDHWPVPVVGSLPLWAKALIVTGLASVFWTDGHRFDRPWKLLYRYGWAPCILAVVTGFWPAVAVGPVVAGAAVLCRWWGEAVQSPWDTPQQQMIDGWEAWWEIGLGAVGVAAFWSAALL